MPFPEIFVLGAEAQAASSLASAFPERRFVFVSDCPVIDGWDLPNVRMLYARPGEALPFAGENAVPLSARWLGDREAARVSRLIPLLHGLFPGAVQPLVPRPASAGPALAKGDLWHRPDHPVSGTAAELAGLADPHRCGVVYQDLVAHEGTVMAIGRRTPSGDAAVGLFRVFAERFFRIDLVQAAESATLPELLSQSLAMLAALSWHGWFTMNWLVGEGGPRLSSIRPVPKAVFRCFREGGIDLLRAPAGTQVLRAGLRMVATPHYAEFKWLAA
jgi:hypothetical protein